ncbi:MAG: oligosaccharide flippase family protein [Candidatus Bathyarchaeota archaeon]|nr:oligosaccharide flippase family protein [Candidatus Termiticorpusculum sp.]
MEDKKQLRLQYSGFIIFTAQILSVITGLVYTLLLTRSMTSEQYGTWTNIFDYTAYFLIFTGFIPFWATRFVARSKEGAVKTSIIANLIIALGSIAIYFPIITLIAQTIGTHEYLPIYYLASLYILGTALITNLEACLRSYKPQIIGYGILIAEIVKIVLAFIIILGLKQLFLGAILSLTLSFLIQAFYYIQIFKDEFKQKIRLDYLKEWLKGSTLIAYNAAGTQLLAFALVLLYYFGGAETRAYYQVAWALANIITYASSLAFALYPKLLSNSAVHEHVDNSFKMVLMFAIPIATLNIVMSTSFLTVLNIDFAIAWPALIMLTIDTLIVMVSAFYNNYLMGTENFDTDGKIPLRQLPKTRIFKVFSLSFIQAAISLPLIYLVLTQIPATPIESVIYVILVNIGVHTTTFIGLYLVMHKQIKLPIAWQSITKYILAAATMALILYLTPTTTTLMLTFIKTVTGISIYLLLLLAIDKQARKLLKLIIAEIKNTLNTFTPKRNNRQLKTEI